MNNNYNEIRYLGLIKFAKTFTKVLYKIAMILAIISILIFMLVLIIPNPIIKMGGSTLETFKFSLGSTLQFNLDYTFANNEQIKLFVLFVSMNAFFYTSFSWIILYLLHLVLVDVKAGIPFSLSNVKNIYRIAFSIIIASVVIPILSFVLGAETIMKLNINSISVNFGINTSMLALGLLILILASVFQYGSYLQYRKKEE